MVAPGVSVALFLMYFGVFGGLFIKYLYLVNRLFIDFWLKMCYSIITIKQGVEPK